MSASGSAHTVTFRFLLWKSDSHVSVLLIRLSASGLAEQSSRVSTELCKKMVSRVVLWLSGMGIGGGRLRVSSISIPIVACGLASKSVLLVLPLRDPHGI